MGSNTDMDVWYLNVDSPFSKFPILGNRFLLVRLLGKGGNGEVWDVIDYADKKRCCALKLSTSIKHAQREHFTHSVRNREQISAAAHVSDVSLIAC